MTAIGVDTGGTFTDVVLVAFDGSLRITKIPSSRADPASPVAMLLSEHLPKDFDVQPKTVTRFVHGTTVATNAVLERKGARLGLLATDGFADIIEIGSINRGPQLYDIAPRPVTPTFLVPRSRRKGIVERIEEDGSISTPLDRASLEREVSELIADGVDAIAVCFLFSFVNPLHERLAGEYIRSRYPEVAVTLSCEVDPAFREYERTCVASFDAYVKPLMSRYLGRMERSLAGSGVIAPFQVMQSRGGVASSSNVQGRPIRLFLSGPAGGTVGAISVGASTGIADLISLDVGGTSSDIALISDGKLATRPDGYVDGHLIRVPMVDVNAVGAGGGSIAWIDSGGGLRVGPQSAGAEPGPACYGRGGKQATVTDASVVLGWLDPSYFAGGSLSLRRDLAVEAVRETVARPLGLGLEEAALGIHRVVNAQMAEGIRLVSVRRGIDPRKFALVAFGGGGPIHATALADELSLPKVVIPNHPGVLSAIGLLAAPIEHEESCSFVREMKSVAPEEVIARCQDLEARCADKMARESTGRLPIVTQYAADVCYLGQSYYLEISIDASDPGKLLERAYESFRQKHEQVYGHAMPKPARFVNLRAVQQAFPPIPQATPASTNAPLACEKGFRSAIFAGERSPVRTPIFARHDLALGQKIPGPAIVEQPDTTIIIAPTWQGEVHASGAMILTRKAQ